MSDGYKLKAFADNKFKATSMPVFFLGRLENIVG